MFIDRRKHFRSKCLVDRVYCGATYSVESSLTSKRTTLRKALLQSEDSVYLTRAAIYSTSSRNIKNERGHVHSMDDSQVYRIERLQKASLYLKKLQKLLEKPDKMYTWILTRSCSRCWKYDGKMFRNRRHVRSTEQPRFIE